MLIVFVLSSLAISSLVTYPGNSRPRLQYCAYASVCPNSVTRDIC